MVFPFGLVAFLLFFTAGVAETNRAPFDFPEAEQELVAGYHTEYSGMKFGMFFLAEYVNLWVASLVIVTLFLGGYLIPGEVYFADWFYENDLGGLLAFLHLLMFLAKVIFIAMCFIWVRWTLPRFKYNQLMTLGWAKLLPIALVNLMVVALVITIWHSVAR